MPPYVVFNYIIKKLRFSWLINFNVK
jgi:hypothetical protein